MQLVSYTEKFHTSCVQPVRVDEEANYAKYKTVTWIIFNLKHYIHLGMNYACIISILMYNQGPYNLQKGANKNLFFSNLFMLI